MKQSRPKRECRNRDQIYLGMVDLDKLIDEWHPARAVWAVLEGIDFSLYEEQIRSREGEAGRSAAPPRLLAALWIYGYSLGVGSARARERAERIQASLRELQRRQQESKRGREVRVSTSEPEVRRMRMADGVDAPAWNLQLATETAGNVAVGVEVMSQGSDAEQLPGMVEQIRRRLGRAGAQRDCGRVRAAGFRL